MKIKALILGLASCGIFAIWCQPTVQTALGSRPGAYCWGDTALCKDRQFLVCVDHRVEEFECAGATGCVTEKRGSFEYHQCDLGDPEAGAACPPDSLGDYAWCSSDRKARYHCVAGTVQLQPCGGPAGCYDEHHESYCDDTVTSPGVRCWDEGASSCSLDGDAMLICRNGVFVVDLPCRGAAGCSVESASGDVLCYRDRALPNDSCQERESACSVDLGQVLVCEDGTFVVEKECACEVDAAGARCIGR